MILIRSNYNCDDIRNTVLGKLKKEIEDIENFHSSDHFRDYLIARDENADIEHRCYGQLYYYPEAHRHYDKWHYTVENIEDIIVKMSLNALDERDVKLLKKMLTRNRHHKLDELFSITKLKADTQKMKDEYNNKFWLWRLGKKL